MSIRPIDLNGMIQNTQEVSKDRSAEQNRPMVQQDFVAIETQNEVELAAEQVHEFENATDGEMDASNGNGQGYERRNGAKGNKNKKKKKVSDGVVRLKNGVKSFDMKI